MPLCSKEMVGKENEDDRKAVFTFAPWCPRAPWAPARPPAPYEEHKKDHNKHRGSFKFSKVSEVQRLPTNIAASGRYHQETLGNEKEVSSWFKVSWNLCKCVQVDKASQRHTRSPRAPSAPGRPGGPATPWKEQPKKESSNVDCTLLHKHISFDKDVLEQAHRKENSSLPVIGF